jgi:hypothetical protein
MTALFSVYSCDMLLPYLLDKIQGRNDINFCERYNWMKLSPEYSPFSIETVVD